MRPLAVLEPEKLNGDRGVARNCWNDCWCNGPAGGVLIGVCPLNALVKDMWNEGSGELASCRGGVLNVARALVALDEPE